MTEAVLGSALSLGRRGHVTPETDLRCHGKRAKIEGKEGDGMVSRQNPPPLSVMIEPLRDRLDYDIKIPINLKDFRLSETKPFQWRRNLPPLEAKKTIFNYVAAYNPFERQFAEFLDQATDVLRFAALGATEQGGSRTSFKVDYLKPSGAVGYYHPDWVAVQDTEIGELNWIIETKGRVWPDTEQKDIAVRNWCKQMTSKTDAMWKYISVNQSEFNPEFNTLQELVVAVISRRMFTERDQRGTAMSGEEVRQARDEGRR